MVTILIVDDLKTVREGLRTIFELYDEIEVVGEAEDGQQAISLCKTLHPNIVIMDIKMPIMDGVEATRKIKQECLADKVVILTIDSSMQTRKAVCEAGADAFVDKADNSTHLIRTILQLVQKMRDK